MVSRLSGPLLSMPYLPQHVTYEAIYGKTEELGERLLINALMERMQAQQWNLALSLGLPALANDGAPLMSHIAERAHHLACHTTVEHIGRVRMAELWAPVTTRPQVLSPGPDNRVPMDRITVQAQELAASGTAECAVRALYNARWRTMAQVFTFAASVKGGTQAVLCADKAVKLGEAVTITAVVARFQEERWHFFAKPILLADLQKAPAEAIVAKCALLADRMTAHATGETLLREHSARMTMRQRAEAEKLRRAKENRLLAQFLHWRNDYQQGRLTLTELAQRCASEPLLQKQLHSFKQHLDDMEQERRYWEALRGKDSAPAKQKVVGASAAPPQEENEEDDTAPTAPASQRQRPPRRATPRSGPRFGP